MYKLFTALCLSIVFSMAAFAQTLTPASTPTELVVAEKEKARLAAVSSKNDSYADEPTKSGSDYNKNEFFIGYSNQQVDSFGRNSFHGVQGAYTRNISRWFGIRADISYARKSQTFVGTLNDPVNGSYNFIQDSNRSVANFLGGVQIKDNASTKRFKPFGYALGGVAVNTSEFKDLACASSNCPASIPVVNNFRFTDTGIAGAFGGGLDIRVTRRIDFRAIQFDYNPIYSDSRVDNNFRIGIGIVFK
jgi:hypothetical protein